MHRISLLLLFLIILISELPAFPRFALRSGGACIDCHVNPTGGGMRNSSGWAYGKNNLTLDRATKQTSEDDAPELSPMIGKNISLGADFRTQFLYTSGFRKISGAGDTTYHKRSDFQKMTGSVYVNVDLGDDFNIYARNDFVWSIWEAYGVAKILPMGGWLKMGVFSPNFGIRVDDHTAYTRGGDLGVLFPTGGRQGFIYDAKYAETGVEAGWALGETGQFTISAGNGKPFGMFSADPTYTARVELTPQVSEQVNVLLGGSFMNMKDAFNGNRNVNAYGFFFGTGLQRFSLLGEYNMAKSYYTADKTASFLMLEGSYKIIKGLEAVVRYDRLDPDGDKSDDELAHIIAGFAYYPMSFVEIMPQYRVYTETPSKPNDSFVLQFHFYY